MGLFSFAYASVPSLTTSDANITQVARSPNRGFSFHSLVFLSNRKVKPALSTAQEHKKEAKASAAFFKRQAKVTKTDNLAKQSALIIRSLIIGKASIFPPSSSTATNGISKPQLSKVKSQLMQSQTANKVIAQLRALPCSDGNVVTEEEKVCVWDKPAGPIHAVCLDITDLEWEQRHFASFKREEDVEELAAKSPSVANASIDKLARI